MSDSPEAPQTPYAGAVEEAAPDPVESASFEQLVRHLKEVRGFDFSGYKRASLMRRVRRRMQAVGIADFEEYRDHLELHPAEFTDLFNTILINVTGFFRDADAWAHLRSDVLPALLEKKGNAPLRIWSAGCATGEEAFSMAIALAEELGPEEVRRRVKFYATDVDEEALAEARQATYHERDLRGVPENLVEKYFERTGQRYTFAKDLRRSVIFGRNDLVQDAPISHVDLLLCRNTLMYFNAETQASVVQRLHFAMEDSGVLFLGKAEMLLSHAAVFTPLDLKRRFFRKVVGPGIRERNVLGSAFPLGSVSGTPDYLATLRAEALQSSPVAQVVIDREGRVVVSNQRADELFGLSPRLMGRPFQDLEVSYRPVELRSLIEQALTERRPVWVRDVELARAGATTWLDIQIVPLSDRDGAVLGTGVIFNDVTRYRQLRDELEYAHRQLETAYEELQSTNEELETTNEELQSTVEELETTNEELQSTNEELETMNEELQSMNDELQSSNDALRERTTEVSDLNTLMESVLTAMQAGVAVVDRDLKVQVWNSRADDLWGARQDETIGQHLLNLDIGLPLERLRPLIRRALNEEGDGPSTLVLDAVNRRGRNIQVSVAVTPLRQIGADITGALIVMSSPD
jgi:two-component system CheB/CheR fusion protein